MTYAVFNYLCKNVITMKILFSAFLCITLALVAWGGEPPVKDDYSRDYMTDLLLFESKCDRPVTAEFLAGEYRLSQDFFAPTQNLDPGYVEAPVVGVLSRDFKPIEVYFSSVTTTQAPGLFDVGILFKNGKDVYSLQGSLSFNAIYFWDHRQDDYYCPYTFILVGTLVASDDSGHALSGTYSATGYATEDNPNLVLLDDLNVVADGYENRSFAGTIDIDGKKELCMWSDYRMPYRFDFDTGDGEMMINPKYNSPEWDALSDRFDTTQDSQGKRTVKYRNPWWTHYKK